MRIDYWINAEYLDETNILKLRAQYAGAKPFPHIAIKGFLRPTKARELERALRKQQFSRKEADLFSFSQSADLHALRDKTLKEFLAVLQSVEVTHIVRSITGAKITQGKADASAFIYGPGDHLLCHDDGVSSRRVAYILNLSTLNAINGGALTLFASKANRPTSIAKRIRPQRNSLVLFGVTRRSHHMVEEVLSGERLTATGWFHG
jgi:Rps23 Pro-64 3,4-dihydroxylase Tpa1-like proline 4-hydroxylase